MRISKLLLILLSQYLIACTTTPYIYKNHREDQTPRITAQNEKQIERGEPYKLIDGVGHYFFSLPSKLILWNWDVENHSISQETEEHLVKFLQENDLTDVKVRLNEYSPGGEFSRLFNNPGVGWGWRYTFGLLTVLGYTIFPGRVFGGDSYNPYTNTISLYSDHPAIALHEAGHALDFARTKYKGSRAFTRLFPIVPLYDESVATGDALGYYEDKKDYVHKGRGYKVLYPAWGTYIGGELVNIFPGRSLLGLAGVIPGHIIGRINASQLPEENIQQHND